MALTKEVKYDKVEIVGDYKHVQLRQATIVSEDGVELSRSFHRHVFTSRFRYFRRTARGSGYL